MLADIYRRGQKGQRIVQMEQVRVYLRFCVPAIVKDPALFVQFSGHYGVPHFRVQVEPWASEYRLDDDDRQLTKASEQLRGEGFQTNGRYWAKVHEPDEYLDAPDVSARLVELIESDVRAIVQSRILDHDLDAGLNRKRGGPPRYRKPPTYT